MVVVPNKQENMPKRSKDDERIKEKRLEMGKRHRIRVRIVVCWMFVLAWAPSNATFTATLGDWQVANSFPPVDINWDAKRNAGDFVCLSPDWTGITCTASVPKTVDLDLRHMSLTGPLDDMADTGSFKVLTLDLEDNVLTGTLPSGWSRLTTLTEIDLSKNSLTGPLPDEWSRLQNLEILDLEANPAISGTIPASWRTEMTRLDKLDLRGTSVCGLTATSESEFTAAGLDLRYDHLACSPPPAPRERSFASKSECIDADNTCLAKPALPNILVKFKRLKRRRFFYPFILKFLWPKSIPLELTEYDQEKDCQRPTRTIIIQQCFFLD
ncbi:hypothetical protein BSKO_10509 [Bryopsis sp. KO-2023]|nr:hypothetical protein BSKO_10509 [Bryopsis sp. KO-2023]